MGMISVATSILILCSGHNMTRTEEIQCIKSKIKCLDTTKNNYISGCVVKTKKNEK